MSAPLSQAKKVTMVSSGKGDIGVSKLTNEVFEVMAKLPHVVEGMTGVDISKVSQLSSFSYLFPRPYLVLFRVNDVTCFVLCTL